MAKIKVLVKAQATIEVEEEYWEEYSQSDVLEAADNSRLGWTLLNVEVIGEI